MTHHVRVQLQMPFRQAAVAIFAIGAMAGTGHACPPSSVVVFAPMDEYAVSDLPKVRDPKLITAPGLTLPGLISDAGHCAAVDGPTVDAPTTLDFGPIDTVLSYELSRMFDVKQVRAQMTLTDTGTTFMPTERGIRDRAPRP
jgi:hypothetical protein